MKNILGSGEHRYRVVENWAKLPDGRSFKEVGSVGVDKNDNVYVFNRGEHPGEPFLWRQAQHVANALTRRLVIRRPAPWRGRSRIREAKRGASRTTATRHLVPTARSGRGPFPRARPAEGGTTRATSRGPGGRVASQTRARAFERSCRTRYRRTSLAGLRAQRRATALHVRT